MRTINWQYPIHTTKTLEGTMSDVNYAETYWSEKGKHEALVRSLTNLVAERKDPKANPALEKFRVASNCYYDLYNNGLGNKAQEFRRVFGFSGIQLTTTGRRGGDLTQRLVDKTEAKINQIILAAAIEQGVESYKLDGGRVIVIDGKPACFLSTTSVNGFESNLSPVEADTLARLIVTLLNKHYRGE
jgi:hypothetical protein